MKTQKEINARLMEWRYKSPLKLYSCMLLCERNEESCSQQESLIHLSENDEKMTGQQEK